MIDIEGEVYIAVSKPLRDKYKNPAILIFGEPVKVPAGYPTVTIVQMDNSVYERTEDSSGIENHAVSPFEINIYSNLQIGKKAQCKQIAADIDAIMRSLGFKRLSSNPISNLDDSTIYRIVSRYRAVVSKEGVVYSI